jgi:hypothetical protein
MRGGFMNNLKLLFIAIIAGAFLTPLTVNAADLDGTAWRIHEKGKAETEDLIFVNNQFTSSGCIPYGFLTSNYSSTKIGEDASWSALQTNAAKETMDWKGKTNGKEMSGTYIFIDKKGKSWTTEWTGKKLEVK